MSAKTVKQNFSTVLAKAVRDYLKNPSGDTFYAAVSFPFRQDFVDYSGWDDSDAEGVYQKTDSDIAEVDEAFYARHTISLHKLYAGGVSRITKRQDWTYGKFYEAWPKDSSHVVVKSFTSGVARLDVYRCLFSPLTPSTIAPSDRSFSAIYTADNYVWKYLYTISDTEAILFMNEEWIPVPEKISLADAAATSPGSVKYQQYLIQKNAVYGDLYNIEIDQASTNSDILQLIASPGTTLSVKAYDLSGSTPSVYAEFNLKYSTEYSKILPELVTIGKGYVGPFEFRKNDGTVVSGLSTTLPDGNGHGGDLPEEMKADHVMAVIRNVPENLISHLTNKNTFNMVSLVRNPIDTTTKKVGTKNHYVACRAFNVESNTFSINDVLEIGGVGSSTTVRVVNVSDTKVYYVNLQSESNVISIGTLVNLKGSTSTTRVTAVYDREVIFNSFNHVVVDVKPSRIIRAADQTESFSFIIEFN